jgi:hypothetical protein
MLSTVHYMLATTLLPTVIMKFTMQRLQALLKYVVQYTLLTEVCVS